MDTIMARLTDSAGNLLGGLASTDARLAPPRDETKAAPIQTPARASIPPHYGSQEIVRGLECSFGRLIYVTYSSAETPPQAPDPARPIDCHNQVDRPYLRHYCPPCGGYYCAVHAEPTAHNCNAVIRTD